MFQDIGVSKDLNEQFKKHLTNSEPLDCEYTRVYELLLQAVFFGKPVPYVAGNRDDRVLREGGQCFIRDSGTDRQQVPPPRWSS